MTAKWNSEILNKIDLKKILEIIDNSKGTGANGKPDFTFTLEYLDCKAILCNAVDFNEKIPTSEKESIVYKAQVAVAAKGTITEDKIIKEIKKIERNYLRQTEKRYVLCTSISFKYCDKIKRKRINDTIITFSRYLPTKYTKHIKKIRDISSWLIDTRHDEEYTIVKVFANAPTPEVAALKALESLNYLIGLWNLFLNYQKMSPIINISNKGPINKLILGPLHTIHLPNGKLASDNFWWSPINLQAFGPYPTNNNETKRMLHFEKLFRDKINSLPKNKKLHEYKDKIIWAIKEYSNALDSRDKYVAFLKLWTVLEVMTASVGNYKKTANRASFLFEDTNFHKMVLEHLRHIRNSLVHKNDSKESIEYNLSQLKRYVEKVILMHWKMISRSHSFYKTIEFLDLPADLPELKNRIKSINQAIKFRTV